MPKYQKAGTGIRLLDDLTGAGPVAGATPSTTPQMRAATTYEQYVQPAVLGLRNAVTSVFGDGSDDMLGGLSPAPLAMAKAPVNRAAHSMQSMMQDALRGARSEAIEHVDDVAPRVANNASGESAASMEAMGRRAWEKQTGRQIVRVDRAGNRTPFIGEPGDLRANPGERIGYTFPDGRFEEITRGR
jgi:hypothetical protein